MTTTPHPGQYALEVLDLFPSDGNSGVDLTQNVLDIDLYESIFTSSISGTVTFIDTDNFISNFPVLGQEFLKRVKTTESIFEDTELQQFEDQVVDIDIYMNIDLLKGTVYKNVGRILAKYFNDEDTKSS